MAPQRRSREFRVVGLAEMRLDRGWTQRQLANRFIPPVEEAFISRLEKGKALASPQSLYDLSRIFGSITIEDALSHRYVLIYRGRVRDPVLDPDPPS